MIFYNLMTLNAAAMLDNAVVRQCDDTHNYRPEFRYDFNEKTTKQLILKSTDRHADNALFYQIIAGQYGGGINVDKYRKQIDCILKSLIFVDFESVFSSQKKGENVRRKVGYSIYDDAKWSEEAIDGKCSILFEDGFSLVYEDGEVKTYIPFDKSGNMSRHYKITFIDKDIVEKVDCRLRLGIDFSSLKVVLSKYYAYRGLYLSDGIRVPEDDDHKLNHETVLVIDDDTHDFMLNNEVQNVPVITADENLLLRGEFKSLEKEHPIRLNSFDGEGLVSPCFAEHMNISRKKEVYMKNSGVSFQIRMPYIKGMLHQVDFHLFFKEQLSGVDYYIKDIFGIPRRIADAQIILTKSMFKCAGWLMDYQNIHPEIKDPMEWFFDQFRYYDHALYVCNTDSNMGAEKTTLNYQFLNTMAIDPKDLDILIKHHLNEAHSITKTGAKYAVDMVEYIAEILCEDEDVSNSIPAWRYALDLNPDFVKDPYVQSMLKTDEIARVKDVCGGRIIIDGALKYLSGDLLGLLIHMIYNKKVEKEGGMGGENGLGIITEDGSFYIDTKSNKNAVSRLRRELIRTGKFYTADHARLGLRTDRRYGVLRNPHLSRNEQCSLRPYIPDEKDEKNIYNVYFKHLKNVIMFPYESIDAISLGGADYDGDKVKLILDRRVNAAILKGAYSLNGKDYVRKLPIVDIPSLGAEREPVPEIIPYQLVKSTFSNQVGLISNLAIRIGKREYRPDNPDPSLKNKCAECTLATGLEIDAVKTGVRPNLDRLRKASPSKRGYDYYLSKEEMIKNSSPEEIEKLEITPSETDTGLYGGKMYTASRKLNSKGTKQHIKLFDAELIPLDASAPIVDRLPGYLLEDLCGEWKKESEQDADGKNGRSGESLLFNFQLDKDTGTLDKTWKRKIKQEPDGIEKLDKTAGLVKAYCKIASDASYIRDQMEEASHSIYKNKIWYLMTKFFDPDKEGLPLTHTKIPDAIEMAHSDILKIFNTTAEVEEAINRMEKLDWFFAPSEKREALLYQILGTDILLDETKEILLCDKQDAFFFLKHYLNDVKNEIYMQSSLEEKVSKRKEVGYLKGYSVADYKDFYCEYIKGQENKEPKKLWNDRIINLCREKLAAEELFNNDFDRALKYYYVCRGADPRRHFLWEVFKKREILRNVYTKPKE